MHLPARNFRGDKRQLKYPPSMEQMPRDPERVRPPALCPAPALPSLSQPVLPAPDSFALPPAYPSLPVFPVHPSLLSLQLCRSLSLLDHQVYAPTMQHLAVRPPLSNCGRVPMRQDVLQVRRISRKVLALLLPIRAG